MSTYYVIAGYGDFYIADGSPVIYVPSGGVVTELDLDPSDILSAPAVNDILDQSLMLWPRGAAWGTPDGMALARTATLSRFTSALVGAFCDLYARLWGLTLESRSASLVDSLADWEADYGLPEPCATAEMSVAQRRRFLRAKVINIGAISPQDFARLADFLGYVVAIEEPDVFRCGESACGSADEVSDVPLDLQWVVHVNNIPVQQFEAGIGEAGVTRILDFDASPLECSIRRAAPAWTNPFFNYDGWPSATLTTEAQEPLLTEAGDAFIV